jgi:membrane protein implicated in regulation of membrane protease activity
MEWLINVEYGHWWILAGVLLFLELLSPTYFFLWLGIAAAAVGFLVLVFSSMPFETQFVAFGVLAIISTMAWYRFRESPSPADTIKESKK